MTGRAHIIMDNLIAEKKAEPMVVVMPLARGGGSLGLGPSGMSPGIAAAGNVAPGAGRGAGAPGSAGAAAREPRAVRRAGAAAAVRAGLHRRSACRRREDVPRLDAGRRIARSAGLSAGGAATINTAFSRPDLFRYIVIMSAGARQNVEAAVSEVLRQWQPRRRSR